MSNLTEKDIIAFAAIKALFETGKIKEMRQIAELSPTKMSKHLKINYGRYIEKLSKPELFVIRELMKMSKILDVDFKLLSNIVINEIARKL